MANGSRPTSCTYNLYIADGFAEDCDELVHRCSKKHALTYQTFCTIWKDMNFAIIYKGRALGSEIAELSEEVIHVAKRYMVANTNNFEESVAGVFLVYALINLQPFSGFAALRLVPEDVPAIRRIELVARRDRRYDVLYILGSVLVKGPCQFHAAQRERGMELQYRKYVEGSMARPGERPKGVFYRQNEEFDVIKEFNSLNVRYGQFKSRIKGYQNDPSLQYVDHELGRKLDVSLKKIVNGLVDNVNLDKDPEDESSSSGRLSNVQAIKNKAMRTTVNPMKHLTGVTDRPTTIPSPKKETDISSEAATTPRTWSAGPPKSVTDGSPTKRRKTNSKTNVRSKPRRKRKPIRSSSSEDDDISVGKEHNADLNLEEFGNNAAAASTNQIEQEIEVEISSLPVLIRTDNQNPHKSIEIEIIDQFKTKKKKSDTEEPVKKKRMLTKKLWRLDDVSLKKIEETDRLATTKPATRVSNSETITEMAELSKITSSDDSVFKKPSDTYQTPKLRKIEKRDLKKPLIKSKFKRMGMLPVANFKETK